MRIPIAGLIALALFAACVAPASAPPVPATIISAHSASPIRIMELGDSITAGVAKGGVPAGDGGYRGRLAQLLRDQQFNVTFVGSRTDYSYGVDDPAHEGWPGYVIRSCPSSPGPGQLYGEVTNRAITAYDPDLILLMAGTNDLLRLAQHKAGYTHDQIATNMDKLIGQILALKPSVRLIVAPVVDSPKIPEADVDRFNEALAVIVDKYSQMGYAVSLARNMDRVVPRDRMHFPDGIHPSGAEGYAAIATDWYQAIEAIAVPVSKTAAAR